MLCRHDTPNAVYAYALAAAAPAAYKLGTLSGAFLSREAPCLACRGTFSPGLLVCVGSAWVLFWPDLVRTTTDRGNLWIGKHDSTRFEREPATEVVEHASPAAAGHADGARLLYG